MTVLANTVLDPFVLTAGNVYDTVLRTVNISESAMKLTLTDLFIRVRVK